MDSDSRHGCSDSRKTIEALPQALHNINGRTITINHYFQWNSANFANSRVHKALIWTLRICLIYTTNPSTIQHAKGNIIDLLCQNTKETLSIAYSWNISWTVVFENPGNLVTLDPSPFFDMVIDIDMMSNPQFYNSPGLLSSFEHTSFVPCMGYSYHKIHTQSPPRIGSSLKA
jgi:hypothetical protein